LFEYTERTNSTFKHRCGPGLENASVAPTRCTSSNGRWIRWSTRPERPACGSSAFPLQARRTARASWLTLNDLIDQARANPGKPNYASSGIGSPLHLAAELLKNVTKTNFVHVAYKGGVPALGR
jgi:hypothetical protein